MIFNLVNGASSLIPAFAYTGSCVGVNADTPDWQVKFLTSGVLTVETPVAVDAFLVGGGASGSIGGGGSGYTGTFSNIHLVPGTEYAIVIGAGGVPTAGNKPSVPGGTTMAFGQNVSGGLNDAGWNGGSGGSGGGAAESSNGKIGGAGGSDGSDGEDTVERPNEGGKGQGTTTRAFGEPDGERFAGAGGGGLWTNTSGTGGGNGGAGGGGNGGHVKEGSSLPQTYPTNGVENTGGGGGGCISLIPGSGGSGIVIIRRHRG